MLGENGNSGYKASGHLSCLLGSTKVNYGSVRVSTHQTLPQNHFYQLDVFCFKLIYLDSK